MVFSHNTVIFLILGTARCLGGEFLRDQRTTARIIGPHHVLKEKAEAGASGSGTSLTQACTAVSKIDDIKEMMKCIGEQEKAWDEAVEKRDGSDELKREVRRLKESIFANIYPTKKKIGRNQKTPNNLTELQKNELRTWSLKLNVLEEKLNSYIFHGNESSHSSGSDSSSSEDSSEEEDELMAEG